MNKRAWITTMLLVVFVLQTLNVQIVFGAPGNTIRRRPNLEEYDRETLKELSILMANYIKGKSVLNSINTILLLYLLFIYYGVYRDTKSTFSLGLVFLSSALLIYSITSNPILIWSSGFKSLELGKAFDFIPDIFTTIASVILIYLSRQ
jgi:hypothetical protein